MLTKNALNNMKNRYTAVLKKCRLLNTFGVNIFGTLAVMGALTGFATGLVTPSSAMAATQDQSAGTIINNDTINVSVHGTDVNITGIKVSVDGDISITNNGTMNVWADADSIDAYTSAYAYGMYASSRENALLTNSGTMNVWADAVSTTGYTTATAYGMDAYPDDDSTLINSGTMNVWADAVSTTGYATATAYGMYSSTKAKIIFTNSGTMNILVNAYSEDDYAYAHAYAMYANGSKGADSTLTNSGTINASANAKNGADAYGMAIKNKTSGDNTLTNTGTITASAITEGAAAYAKAYGMTITDETSGTNTLTNSGTITVSAFTEGVDADITASGMYVYAVSDGTVQFSNTGTINVTAIVEGAGADIHASGMYVENAGEGTSIKLTNSGIIKVTATAQTQSSTANAYGMGTDEQSSGDITLFNSGFISVTAQSAEDTAAAYGMITGASTATIDNSGIITVTATSEGDSAQAYGVSISAGSSTINNAGIIMATATNTFDSAGEANAYGIYVEGDDSSHVLNNTGLILVSATSETGSASAYQAYVNGGTATIGTWNILLGKTYGVQDNGSAYYLFGGQSDSELVFNDDTEFVIVGLGSDFERGATYAISDMIDSQGTVTGSVGSVSSPFDLLKVELVDTGDGSSYMTQSIKGTVNITAKNSPAQSVASTAMSGVSGYMGKLGNILAGVMSGKGGKGKQGGNGQQGAFNIYDTGTMTADAGGVSTDAGGSYLGQESPVWDAFILPFYSYTSENGGDYSTDMMGLAMGATRSVCDNFDLGFHFSIAKADSEADYTDSDATSYALGLHGMYKVDEAWYVRGQVSGFYSESDFNIGGSTSNNLVSASADMDTYGVYMELATGYDFEIAPAHTITPELGLSYMYAYMEGFDSEYYIGSTATGSTFSMDSEDFDALYADASVRWTGAFDLEKGVLKPTVKAGIRQALTDPEVSSTLEIFGTKGTTHSDLNETAFTCEAGLSWELGDVVTSLTYVGEFGDVEYSHMGMFKVAWEF